MNTETYKKKLIEEKNLLEKELGSFAVKSSSNPNDWESIPPETDDIATRDEVADRLEDQSERKATEIELESQLAKVNDALERIASDSYGVCVICHNSIEEDRLEATPSAKTCKLHREQE